MSQNRWHPVLVRAVIQCLREIFNDGFYADKVIERAFKLNKKWGSRDRKFIAETVYDMVRWWGRLCFYDQQPFKLEAPGDLIKRWVFYERWKHGADALEFATAGFPEYDLTKVTVSAIDERLKLEPESPWDQLSYPRWVFAKFEEAYGTRAARILEALNEVAPVCLRANSLKTDRASLEKTLEAEGVVTREAGVPNGLVLTERKNVFVTKAFKVGLFEVQDLASQRVAPLLDPKPGERIADVCAGAGGKTLHLAALMKNKGTLVAGDVSEIKLEQLKVRARRAGVSNLRIQHFDGSKSVKRLHESFDGVLIDAPCSGTGVIRRNCDTKWKLLPDQFERLVQTQQEILETYSKLVRPGGRLVYATCSLLPEENEKQVARFLEKHSDFESEGEPLRTNPLAGEDGFFAQRLKKKS